ncbi:UNVERIFIED_CONTAM: hypothetical protein Sradi_3711400 [Sesamum radiatum]|uniref:Uncharacterized protein n=1 Tax=Sesamum radiatum TaxID=300843 RepID=A0AAW2PXL7_SESRA
MKISNHHTLSCFLLFNFLISSIPLLLAVGGGGGTSIAFATLGRSSYAFDIFALPTAGPSKEIRLTDGNSVNFNGYFPSSSSLSMLPHLSNNSDPATHLVYITERNGSSKIYLDALYDAPPIRSGSRSLVEGSAESTRLQVLLVGDEQTGGRVSMKDKPSLVGQSLIYVSTHENAGVPRASWAAVFSTQLTTGVTRRLTPKGVADFSPAVSPSGVWTAVASYGEKGWDGRRCEDGWWSVFRATFSTKNGRPDYKSVVTQRVTPPGLHAFTPAASAANKRFIAVATRRPESEFRHIELYDVVSNEFLDLTLPVSPNVHHFNPFFSPDASWVGYHKCRGATSDGKSNNFVLENVQSPVPDISLFRIDGSFPSYSPDGERIAYVKFPGLYVMNSDGSGIRTVLTRTAFSTAWDWKRKGVVYTSVGPTFASESTKVDIVSINVDERLGYKKLTLGGENNAFPSPSPDGKWVVFRSGRSGHKNLYIMDALNGEAGGLYRLTEGPWTDTMGNWSPDGEWIAFASDRENPGSAEPIANPHHYQPYGDIFVIKADGSGIQRLTHNSYEDGTPAWSPKFMSPANVEWPNGGSKCSFDDCHWLNISPDQGSSSSNSSVLIEFQILSYANYL